LAREELMYKYIFTISAGDYIKNKDDTKVFVIYEDFSDAFERFDEIKGYHWKRLTYTNKDGHVVILEDDELILAYKSVLEN
jgi:hypothetical protein